MEPQPPVAVLKASKEKTTYRVPETKDTDVLLKTQRLVDTTKSQDQEAKSKKGVPQPEAS